MRKLLGMCIGAIIISNIFMSCCTTKKLNIVPVKEIFDVGAFIQQNLNDERLKILEDRGANYSDFLQKVTRKTNLTEGYVLELEKRDSMDLWKLDSLKNIRKQLLPLIESTYNIDDIIGITLNRPKPKPGPKDHPTYTLKDFIQFDYLLLSSSSKYVIKDTSGNIIVESGGIEKGLGSNIGLTSLSVKKIDYEGMANFIFTDGIGVEFMVPIEVIGASF